MQSRNSGVNAGTKTDGYSRPAKLAYGGLLIALGILLPQVFHIFGQNTGMIFLPIQAPFMSKTAFVSGIVMGIPGMVIQMCTLPVLYKRLIRGNLLAEGEMTDGK